MKSRFKISIAVLSAAILMGCNSSTSTNPTSNTEVSVTSNTNSQTSSNCVTGVYNIEVKGEPCQAQAYQDTKDSSYWNLSVGVEQIAQDSIYFEISYGSFCPDRSGLVTGTALLKGNTITYKESEGGARFTLTFSENKVVIVQEGESLNCGDGVNMSGTCPKVGKGIPEFIDVNDKVREDYLRAKKNNPNYINPCK